jgi:hypothetical protein
MTYDAHTMAGTINTLVEQRQERARARYADKWVIRSMSTTDYQWGAGAKPVTPYHIYLMRPECRGSAWWSACRFETALFDSPQAADAEARMLFAKHREHWDVVPALDGDIPTYWDIQEMNREARS